jgi:hypothetical protein
MAGPPNAVEPNFKKDRKRSAKEGLPARDFISVIPPYEACGEKDMRIHQAALASRPTSRRSAFWLEKTFHHGVILRSGR